MTHTIIKPTFDYAALEPYIDSETMTIHTEKHHQTYADKLNAALVSYPDLQDHSLEYLLTHLSDLPEPAKTPVSNFAGGVMNHNFFWTVLSPTFDQSVPEPINQAIVRTFGSVDKFKEEFNTKAATLFGSGWTWLVLNGDNLGIINTANQDTPTSQGMTPLLTVDVWEHAYYLKYQNRRPDYIQAFWHIVNWESVNNNYQNNIASG